MVWPNGRKYKGEFYDGKPNGKGTKIDTEGNEIPGYWVGGKFFDGEPVKGLLEKQK
jgi:hypothetical protein